MLYIVATGGNTDPDLFNLEESQTKEPFEFNSGCTIIHNAHFYADSRSYRSRTNQEFAYGVTKAVVEGKDIVLVAPNAEMIEKRLRKQAIILQLRPYDNIWADICL